MKKSFLRNWVCAIHFFSLCYIFSLTSHWSFDPIFVLHPPRIVMLHHLILFLRCFLIFRTFADFSYMYKNRADQWFLLSQCHVNENKKILLLRNWVCAIHFLGSASLCVKVGLEIARYVSHALLWFLKGKSFDSIAIVFFFFFFEWIGVRVTARLEVDNV